MTSIEYKNKVCLFSASFGTIPAVCMIFSFSVTKTGRALLRLLVSRHKRTQTCTDVVACSAESLFLLLNLLQVLTKKKTASHHV